MRIDSWALTTHGERWALPMVCMVALVLRAALFFAGPAQDPQRAFYGDSPRYLRLANNLLTHHSFALDDETSGVIHVPLAKLRSDLGQIEPRDGNGLRPEILRTPGYPAFIAALFATGLSTTGLLAIQCLISVAGVALVYLIARQLLGSIHCAAVGALITAVNPADLVSANSVLTETLFTALMLLGIWLVVGWRNRGPVVTGCGGLVLGLSVLVRPVSILLGPAMGLWVLATNRKLTTVPTALAISMASLLPAAAWAVRNNSVGFGYRLSSVPYINNLFYTGAYMQIKGNGQDTHAHWPATARLLLDELETSLRPGEDVFDAMNRLTLNKVQENPMLYASVIGHSMTKFMTDHSAGDLYKTLGRPYQPSGLRDQLLAGKGFFSPGTNLAALGLAASWMAWNLASALLMIGGLVFLAFSGRWSAALMLGGVGLYFLLTTQAVGLERFRVPVVGLEAVCIAALVLAVGLGRDRPPRPAATAASCPQP